MPSEVTASPDGVSLTICRLPPMAGAITWATRAARSSPLV
jgi:hypothetical protein